MSKNCISNIDLRRSEKKPVITLIFRNPCVGVKSMERLFAAIEPYLVREFEVRRVTLPNPPGSLSRMLGNAFFARRNREGVVHVTGDAHYIVPFLGGKGVILTVHDCGRLMDLTGILKWIYRILWFELPRRTANRITVISKSTKQVFEREIGRMGDNMVLIENCLIPGFEKTQRKFDNKNPRILQIGSGPHKNLDGLIHSVIGIECELMIIGRISDKNRILMESNGIRYRNEFDVTRERLHEIYQESDLLFFASRHEGFGLPILEAQKTGIPVITSNRFSMPDVADGGALIVDPEDHSGIRDAIIQIRDDAILREQLISKGFENINKYSPKTVAEKYAKLYKEVYQQTMLH